MHNFLRPDESSSESRINKNLEQTEKYKRGLQTASNIASTAVGVGAASKVLPFLSDLIPADLAMKGINKISPKIGQFLQKGKAMGLDLKQGFQFIKDNIGATESKKNPLKEFETNHPEIFRAINGYINKGQPPQSAAAILKNSAPFAKSIKKLEKDVGKNFVDYILELFGNKNQSTTQNQPSQQQNALTQESMNPQGSQPNRPPSIEAQAASQQAPQQPAPQQPAPQQAGQQQGVDPQLAQIMQQGQALMQRLRGR